MFERRFEGSDVVETVLHATQPVKGTMSSDTPRAGRLTTPEYQKHSSRSPGRDSSRKKIPMLEAQAVIDTSLVLKLQ